MEVLLAKTAGFCYGVRRAVEMAQDLARSGTRCAMLGPVIHNDHVIAALEAQGMALCHAPDQLPAGATVLLRSHGEPKAVYDALAAGGWPVVDAVCPNVRRIHALVRQAGEEGRLPLIVGTPTHPEVLAIAGWCSSHVVVEGLESLKNWIFQDESRRELPLTMVSQTTAIPAQWKSCVEFAKKVCTNLKIFDTICNATYERQREAVELAARCDAMIVIGDPKSSNTRRLTQLCRPRRGVVAQVASAAELDPSQFSGMARVGITAGASTPGWIIKEVYDTMSEENMIEIEESFEEMLEKSIKTLHTGDKVTGIVTEINPTEVCVDLGTKHAAYIPLDQLTDDPEAKVEDLVKVGQEIEVFVVRVNDAEGVVTLSKKKLDTVKSWEDVENAVDSHAVLEGVITEENKGGIVASVKGVRVFIPASQSGQPRGADLSTMLKKKVRLRITEVDSHRKRVVGSIRAVEQEERDAKAAEVWENIEVGKRYEGVVKSLVNYGAFVDIGGVDGMVHISELSWSRIKHPSEVVSVGDSVSVYVLSFDKEKRKISLGMKDRSQDPWAKFIEQYDVGSVLTAKVVKLMTFGAFAEVLPGVDGLIHISQLSDHRVEKPEDVVSEGQEVTVMITAIDKENKKISLSIRALMEEAQAAKAAAAAETAMEPDEVVATSDSSATTIAPAFDEPAEEAPVAEAPVEAPAVEAPAEEEKAPAQPEE